MFKLGDIAPDIAARVAEWETHRESCTDQACAVCRPHVALSAANASETTTRPDPALKTIPEAFGAAELGADWLRKLVGQAAIEQAAQNLGAPRCAFVGPPGAGKTSLAVAMFRATVEAERKPWGGARHRYTSAHALAKARAAHPLGEGEAPLVEACLRTSLLVLDELGGEDSRHASAVAEVLYERHAEGLRTWVTTGVGPKEIANRYGGGIARRVFEGAVMFRLGKRT